MRRRFPRLPRPHPTSTCAALFLFAFAALMVTSSRPVAAQTPQVACASGADSLIEAGWDAYRLGRISEADQYFSQAVSCAPESVGAHVGLGYAALRQGQDGRSGSHFQIALAARPNNVDALVGLALLAWRGGKIGEAGALAERAVALAPTNQEALDLLARVGAGTVEPLRRVDRPPLVLPDTLVYPSRTNGDRFEVRGPDGWQPFYMKGVNLGAALPGKHPSQFPDSATYVQWIDQMHQMGANVVRTYTIHPPEFYQALYEHNSRHRDNPLWVVHGVWTELPPGGNYEDPEWEGAFFAEMRRVVDLIHGRADIVLRPGHAGGVYTADVSQWVQSFIIGREWEPYSVLEFNELRPDLSSWHGRFLTLDRGTPIEAWLAKASEEIVAYETDTYRAQRPVAYTNWPTLDPMHHPTETTVKEEVAIRRGLGETVGKEPLEYDNDGTNLSAARVRTTAAFPAGHFASYHAYPYYPDFMILDAEYGTAESPFGRSNYYGYLQDLKAHHPNIPVVIAEYGVPTSFGIAHLQPQGWHHGGHSEAGMAEIGVRMTEEIAASGMAGGILFAWIDEWFKKNWITIEFEIPLERNRLWLNRLDAEQQYGVYAMEPGSSPEGADLRGRAASWQSRAALYETSDGASLRAAADEAYLWLRFEGPLVNGRRVLPAELTIGFDTVDPEAGDHRWPGAVGDPLPAGLEFALTIDAAGARLLVDSASNPFLLQPVRAGFELPEPVAPAIEKAPGPSYTDARGDPSADLHSDLPPRDIFMARSEQRFHQPYRSVANSDGRYDSLRVITNRPRFGRDSTEYWGMGYDRGVLPHGPLPEGFWQTDRHLGVIEVRIPWMLLNFTDPSERRVLQDLPDGVSKSSIGAETSATWDASAAGFFGTVTVPDIGIAARWRSAADGETPAGADAGYVAWPATGDAISRFSWAKWEQPRWRARKRPLFDAMRRSFERMEPAVFANPRSVVSGERREN